MREGRFGAGWNVLATCALAGPLLMPPPPLGAQSLRGSVRLERAGGYLFVYGRIESGSAGDMLLDLGTTHTTMERSALPPLAQVAYPPSDGSAGIIASDVAGLGGEVGAFLGRARVGRLRVGRVTVSDLEVDVMDHLPAVGGRPVIAILGSDLLRRSGRVLLRFPETPVGDGSGASGNGALDGELVFEGDPLSPDPSSVPRAVEASGGEPIAVPFTPAAGLVVLAGRSHDVHLQLILDSGARESMLLPSAARALGLEHEARTTQEFTGLDGRVLQGWTSTLRDLALGPIRLKDVLVNVVELPGLARIGSSNAGLLGNSFLTRFRAVEVRWDDRTVRFYPLLPPTSPDARKKRERPSPVVPF